MVKHEGRNTKQNICIGLHSRLPQTAETGITHDLEPLIAKCHLPTTCLLKITFHVNSSISFGSSGWSICKRVHCQNFVCLLNDSNVDFLIYEFGLCTCLCKPNIIGEIGSIMVMVKHTHRCEEACIGNSCS
jgi:hypothetical protein